MADQPELASAEALQKIIDVVPNPVFVKDPQHRWVLLNDALIQLLGEPRQILLGKSDFDVFPAEQAEVFWAKDREVLESGLPSENEEAFTDATGRLRTVVTRKCLVRLGPDTASTFLVGVISDITPYREAEARSHFLSRHDSMTGIANRMRFQEYLREATQRTRGATEALAVLVVDLDGFKAVNDELGHAAGDELLRVIAGRLVAAVRATDLVCRLGGDEFGVILCGDGARLSVERIAQAICATVAAPVPLAEAQVAVSASVGIALSNGGDLGPEELVHQADVAMYEIKRSGRNGYRLHPASGGTRSPRHLDADLRAALPERQLRVAFLPLWQPLDRHLTGHQAVLRWCHPQLGDVAPEIFTPLSERAGLAGAFAAFNLREACAAAVHWPSHLRVVVSVPLPELLSETMLETITDLLVQTGLSPARLQLELSDVARRINDADLMTKLGRIRHLGIRLGLDDFGAAPAGLRLLESFPLDRLRIGSRIIARMPGNERAVRIVASLIRLAHELGAKVTAEGVGHPDHARILAELGCDEVLGPLVGPNDFPAEAQAPAHVQ